MEYRIFEVENGRWGYSISGISQEWNPTLWGFVPMTEEEAVQFAIEEQIRLNNVS